MLACSVVPLSLVYGLSDPVKVDGSDHNIPPRDLAIVADDHQECRIGIPKIAYSAPENLNF
jgi:hypothetical protein